MRFSFSIPSSFETCCSKKYCQVLCIPHIKHATGSFSSVRLRNPRTLLLPQLRSSISQPLLATCYFQSSGMAPVWLLHMVGRMQQSTEAPLRKHALSWSWDESVCSLPCNPVELVVAEGNQHSSEMVTEVSSPCFLEIPHHCCRCTQVPTLCL